MMSLMICANYVIRERSRNQHKELLKKLEARDDLPFEGTNKDEIRSMLQKYGYIEVREVLRSNPSWCE